MIMLGRLIPCLTLCVALTVWSAPVRAGDELVATGDNMFLGIDLREVCVETFPRFKRAASVLDSKSSFERRAGKEVWDHKSLAVTITLTQIEGNPACVLQVIAKRWKQDTWADYAVPALGETWESDQTIVQKGTEHPNDSFGQHLRIRYPTGQYFVFDADRREDGYWNYTVSIIAAN